MFPTDVRSLGMGSNIFFGHLASVFTPYLVDFIHSKGINPVFLLGTVGGLICIFCAFFLPETKGKKIKTKMEIK